MSKKVTFDFYKVESPEGYSFEDAMKALKKVKSLKKRAVEIDDDPIRWEEIDHDNDYYAGDLVKLRMEFLPSKGGLSSKVEDIGLKSDEGIAEETVFLYDKKNQILVFQRNRYGVSATRFQKYLIRFCKVDGLFHFFPLIQESALKRLNAMKDIRKFSYKMARPHNKKHNQISTASTEESLELLDDLDAMSIEIELSMGHYKRSMAVDRVVDKAKKLFKRKSDGDSVPMKIFVSGINDDNDKDSFDLLDLKIYNTEELTPNSNRRLTYSVRKQAAKTSLKKHMVEIKKLYIDKT